MPPRPIALRPRAPALALLVWACASAHAAFDLATVAQKAERLAADGWKEPPAIPKRLTEISYDQWRDIRFRPELALWREAKLKFQIQFFHPGLFYSRTVRMNVVDKGRTAQALFSPSQFDYGKNEFASEVPQDLGYAGFRVHYPIKTNYFDEVIVFLGASYFRSLGRDEGFGLSARGLAVDTAESWGEEFPWFREFWLLPPAQKADQLAVYALLDSPRITGAYQFLIDPGAETVVRVTARLFPRAEIKKLGLAPLTSMFFHGENTARWFDDFRPEVHDSDGLLLCSKTGEWLWRPLDNPKTLSISRLRLDSPAGFGLVQRDRDFASYQDLETKGERRPSAWIVPDGDWGPGRVELVEIPMNDEVNDNVVAYWVSDRPVKAGEPIELSYTIGWYGDDPARPPTGRAISTRRDGGTKEGAQRVVVDFTGKALAAIPAEQVVRGVITVVGGDEAAELLEQQVVKNPFTGGWRLTFQVRPKKREAVELRAFLDQGGSVLTETWSYALRP